jgi:hypothetical protein
VLCRLRGYRRRFPRVPNVVPRSIPRRPSTKPRQRFVSVGIGDDGAAPDEGGRLCRFHAKCATLRYERVGYSTRDAPVFRARCADPAESPRVRT